MQFRGLLIAVGALAVLGGLVYWSNKTEAEKKDAPADPNAAPKVLTVPEDQFKEVRLAKTGGDTTVIVKKDGKWNITAPAPLPADQDSIGTVVNTLSSLNSDRLIEEKAANLIEYGLNNPTLTVTLVKTDGKEQKLLIGDETPTGSSVFAKLDNDPRIFAVATYVKSSLDKTSKDLRDKRLLTFDSDKLTRVELQAKGQMFEFGKNAAADWTLLKPRPLRADNSAVEDLVRKLKDARMDTSLSDEEMKKAAAAFATAPRIATATVQDAGGAQSIEVRKKDNDYYAKSTVVEGIHKVTNDLGDGLNKALDDFRNKKVFDFGWSEPSKLEVKGVAYQKSGDKWTSGGKTIDSGSIQNVIDKLRDLQAAKFLDAGALGAPVLDAAVTSNEGKRVEKVRISKQGDKHYAQRENEPALYEIDTKAVEDLLKAVTEIKEAKPEEKKK